MELLIIAPKGCETTEENCLNMISNYIHKILIKDFETSGIVMANIVLRDLSLLFSDMNVLLKKGESVYNLGWNSIISDDSVEYEIMKCRTKDKDNQEYEFCYHLKFNAHQVIHGVHE